MLCVSDLPDKVGFSQSDLTKIANSVTGFPSKAVIWGVDSHTKWGGKLRQFSGQLRLLFRIALPRKLS